MNDLHLLPPQADIDAAFEIEKNVAQDDRDLYLEFMNGVPMSARKTPRELRDGCILAQLWKNIP